MLRTTITTAKVQTIASSASTTNGVLRTHTSSSRLPRRSTSVVNERTSKTSLHLPPRGRAGHPGRVALLAEGVHALGALGRAEVGAGALGQVGQLGPDRGGRRA